MIIEITNQEVEHRTYTPENSTITYDLYYQEAWLHNGEKYPEKITLRINNEITPNGFSIGKYEIDFESSVDIVRNTIKLNKFLTLKPAKN